ncbi:MAG: Peptidyl-tRNA hydrolase [uncultured Sphingosinicella sp.]|uniref:Peptidyl-tRNA hydrolase n=1 Tax=uncultured Sphingosinicella sp. TaxID=478748 RepID=A0A6J4TKE8_9SPHN|nr:MAG: Peptidyl-tRNA hydrolase [uncultured Sphingosinicella sp.]
MSFLRWFGSFLGPRPVEVPGQPLDAEDASDWDPETVQIWVGLGNPGAQYAMHRHNVGFMAVDAIAEIHRFQPPKKSFHGWAQQGRIGASRILLLKPATFMNDSGRAVRAAMDFFKKDVGDVTIFHDELDLAPFKVKVKVGGGTAGHNGLRSTEAHVGNAFRRVRIGIGHPGHKDRVTGHVLGNYAKAETDQLADMLGAVAAEAEWLAKSDDARFMNEVALRLQS